MDFATAFKIAGLGEDLTEKLLKSLKSARGRKRRLLLELQGNLDILQLWKRNRFPPEGIIPKLERVQYDAALEENFKLNSIKRQPLGKEASKNVPQFRKYIGWSTEKLLDNLYRKIKILSDILELDGNRDKVNMDVRLNNIYKMLVLIITHINS